MSVEQAAQMLGCKRRRVFQLLADGTLQRAPRFGREIRILTVSVEAALTPATARRPRSRRQTTPQTYSAKDIPL